MPRLLLRTVSRPGVWIVAATLLAVADLLAPSQMALCVLHTLLLAVAWRLLHRRYVPLLTASLLLAVVAPGLLALAGVPEPFAAADEPLAGIEPARIWTMLALAAAGLFHANLQQKRRRRLALRRELQRHVRHRTRQVRRVNQALRREVARRQETEHLLDRSETTFKALMDRMQLQVLRKDPAGVITYANDTFCRQLGREPADVIGSTDHDIYPPHLAARYQADDLHVMATGQSVDQIEEHPSRDHQAGFAKVFKAPEYDQRGNCVGIQVIFWDITQEHRGEIALRGSEARKRALFEAAGDAMLLLDSDERIVEANASAIDLFRAPASEMVNHRLEEIAWPAAGPASSSGPAGDRPPAPRRWSELPKAERHEMTLTRGDGSTFESEVSVHAIPVSGTAGLAIIVRDVTPQHRAFEALRDAKAAAEAANRTKTEFMAGVSHELRTPLGGITGLTDLLAETPLSPRGGQYVDLIRHSVSQLSDVIEDILDFAAIEAGRLHIAPTPIDLHAVVGEAFKSLAARAVDKSLSMSLSIAPGTPRYVIGDAKRLRQIIINVAGNAVKFTPKGEVRLRLSGERLSTAAAQQTGGGGCPICIEVADTGIGIAPEKQRDVFEAFERVETGTTRRFGGTGLGLAISDALVRRMGGQIELTSQPGLGSAFRCRMRLPLDESRLAQTPSPAKASAPRPVPAVARVLVGSDAIDAAVRETLQQLAVPCESATAPRTVPETAPILWVVTPGRLAETWPHGGWLGDLRQPADRVVWLTRLGDSAPPAARSGDAVLIEPALPDELIAAIDDASGTPDASAVSDAPHAPDAPDAPHASAAPDASAARPDQRPAPAPGQQRADASGPGPTLAVDQPDERAEMARPAGCLLLVDDSTVNQIVTHDQLTRHGYRVDLASNGQDALASIARRKYDCVLMDLQMPDIDGIETTRRIRRWYDHRRESPPPIIALTAHATDSHRGQCRQAGMAGFVTKPISQERLLEEIEHHTGRGGDEPDDRPSASQGPATPVSTGDADHRSPRADESPDAAESTGNENWREQIAKFAGDDQAMLVSLCDAFLGEVPRLLSEVRQAAEARDATKLRTSAHTLKSCLRYVAPPEDQARAAEIEQQSDQPECVSAEQLDEVERVSRHWVQRVGELRNETNRGAETGR